MYLLTFLFSVELARLFTHALQGIHSLTVWMWWYSLQYIQSWHVEIFIDSYYAELGFFSRELPSPGLCLFILSSCIRWALICTELRPGLFLWNTQICAYSSYQILYCELLSLYKCCVLVLYRHGFLTPMITSNINSRFVLHSIQSLTINLERPLKNKHFDSVHSDLSCSKSVHSW